MSASRRYRLPLFEAFRKQVRFAAAGVVRKQALAAEAIIGELEIDRVYPSEWVVWRITGFRPEEEGLSDQVLDAVDLRRDLTVFVQDLAKDIEFAATDRPAGAVSTAEAAERLGVSVRTLQRWRDKGLPLLPIRFPDGTRRRGCFVDAFESFVAREADVVKRASAFGDRQSPPIIAARVQRMHVEGARRLVLRAHDWRIPETVVAARLGRGQSTVRRLLREARTERLRSLERWSVDLPTASLPSADEVFAVAGQLDDVAANAAVLDGHGLLELLQRIEHVDDRDDANSRIAALHYLHARAWSALAANARTLSLRTLDKIERDIVWSDLLLERASLGVGGEAVRRLEQSLGTRLNTLNDDSILAAIGFVLQCAAKAIERFDPAKKDAFKALPRSVGFAVARGVAQQELQLSPAGAIDVKRTPARPTAVLRSPQRWWRRGGSVGLLDAAQTLFERRHGVGTACRPMTMLDLGKAFGVPPSHLRSPLEAAERMVRGNAVRSQVQK